MRGDYLAIVTLGFAEFMCLVISNETWATGGADGISNIPGPWRSELRAESFAWLMLGLITLCVAVTCPSSTGLRYRDSKVVSGFHRIAPPENARLYPHVRVGDDVSEGDVPAELRDIRGRPLDPLFAPASGPAVYCRGHPIARSDEPAIAIGRLSRHAEAEPD